MWPDVTRDILLSMNVCKIVNMATEFHTCLSEREINCLLDIARQVELLDGIYNPADLVMVKNELRLDILKSLKAANEPMSPINLELLKFTTCHQINENEKSQALDIGKILALLDENVVETVYIKICLINEVRLWDGFAKALPLELHVLVKQKGKFMVVKRPVHFSPFGHAVYSMTYNNAHLYEQFLVQTLKLLVLFHDFKRIEKIRVFPPTNFKYLTYKMIWGEYFGYLSAMMDLMSQLMAPIISYCPLCIEKHYTLKAFCETLCRQSTYYNKLEAALGFF